MIPIAAWRDKTQQVLQRWQQSAHNILERYNDARHRVPETERTPAAESTPLAEQSHQPREEMWNEAGMAVRNPLENGETVRFLVDQRLCELQPGEAHWFAPQQQWHVQFHRGGEFGDVDRVVTEGVYQFSATDQGWGLEPVNEGIRP
jgi:hypothetical protein